jgi:hypothetical protein
MARYASAGFSGFHSLRLDYSIIFFQNLRDNQCIFVRGFRVARILNIWPRLRGEAEPATDEGEHEPEPDRQLLPIGSPDDDDINVNISAIYFLFLNC